MTMMNSQDRVANAARPNAGVDVSKAHLDACWGGCELRVTNDEAGWKELKALDPRVVTIGSHTMTHPILTSLTAEETDSEMRESRFALEKRLEREVSLVCYPNGNLNDGALASARRYYRSAVTVEPGTVKDEADRHQLPRFAAHPRGMKRLVRRMLLG